MLIQTASNVKIAFDDTSGSKPILVLLHAFPLSREMWRSQRENLKDVARILTLDLRGFGGTNGFNGIASVDLMADDVAGFLDALNIREPVALGGLSMGGYVALAFARKYPDRLRALILADTKAEPDDDTAKANRNKMIAFAKENKPSDVIAQMMPKMVSESTRATRSDVVAEVERIAAAQTIPGIVGALHALRDRPDAGPGLGAIAVPTLVIVGEEDVLTPPTVAEQLAARIPGAKLERIPSAGHLTNMEQPPVFNDAVRRFLSA